MSGFASAAAAVEQASTAFREFGLTVGQAARNITWNFRAMRAASLGRTLRAELARRRQHLRKWARRRGPYPFARCRR